MATMRLVPSCLPRPHAPSLRCWRLRTAQALPTLKHRHLRISRLISSSSSTHTHTHTHTHHTTNTHSHTHTHTHTHTTHTGYLLFFASSALMFQASTGISRLEALTLPKWVTSSLPMRALHIVVTGIMLNHLALAFVVRSGTR